MVDTVSRLLLATHGGDSATGAARVAVLLAQRLAASLDTIAVLRPPPMMDAGVTPVFIPDATMDLEAMQQLRTGADEQLRRCGWSGAAGAECVEGFPIQAILANAHAHRTELIVVGLGAHHMIERALGGETALRLAQVADLPVLAVPGDVSALPRRAIAAIDFSPTSIEAARLVATWLTAGDVLHLTHVAHAATHASGPGSAVGGPRSTPSDRLLAIAAKLGAPAGVTVDTVELTGDPARVVLEFAEREHADLIALGSHGYGAWKRFLLGSVASKVLRLATCSVLVVPTAQMRSGEGTTPREPGAAKQPSTTPAQ